MIPNDKFVKKIDMGERDFFFRLDRAKESTLERLAWEFNVPPYACNVFPAESGLSEETPAAPIIPTLSDVDIVLITRKKQHGEDAYLLRLLNNCAEEKDCTVSMGAESVTLHFGKYEVKTVRYDGTLTESDQLLV